MAQVANVLDGLLHVLLLEGLNVDVALDSLLGHHTLDLKRLQRSALEGHHHVGKQSNRRKERIRERERDPRRGKDNERERKVEVEIEEEEEEEVSYTVTKLHLDELLHECNGCLFLRAYTTLHHPQVGVPER